MKIKFILLLFLLLVTFSAIANYNLPKEKLKKVKLQLNNKTFELCVPKGYMLSINYTPEEIEYLFRYQDSSCICLSGFFYCKNERNISLLGDSIYNLRFQNTKLIKEINELLTKNKIPIKPDTIKLKGIQENQLMWKDILLKDISVGYYNVSKINVALFDRSISSLKQKMK